MFLLKKINPFGNKQSHNSSNVFTPFYYSFLPDMYYKKQTVPCLLDDTWGTLEKDTRLLEYMNKKDIKEKEEREDRGKHFFENIKYSTNDGENNNYTIVLIAFIGFGFGVGLAFFSKTRQMKALL